MGRKFNSNDTLGAITVYQHVVTLTGEPLLVFHGGNATTAYNLLACDFLFQDFHIYAVDTIGHPGKSAMTCLSPFGYDYGRWAGEVIEKRRLYRNPYISVKDLTKNSEFFSSRKVNRTNQ